MFESGVKQVKTQIQKYYQKLPITTLRFQTARHNSYQLCKAREEDPYQYFHKIIKNTQATPQVQLRLKLIKQLPHHQNVVPVCASGHNSFKNQVYILSQYLEDSQSLETLIQNVKLQKRKITEGQLKFIFYQVIQAMVFLQQNKMNHLRLNPSAILIKFPKHKQQKYHIDRYYKYPLARVCDLGIANQVNYPFDYCLHPDFFDPNKKNCYNEKQYQNRLKYDLWALGSIIYYSIKQKKPFYGKQKLFSDNQVFKLQYAKDPRTWLNKKVENNFLKNTILQRFIYKSWTIYGQKPFKSWIQVKQFFQFQATKMQKTPIDTIFTNHVRLIFLFSKIFIIMNQQAHYRASRQNQINNQRSMLKLSSYLFQLADAYHVQQFENNFKNRCYALPPYKRKLLQQITKSYSNQLEYIKNFSSLCKKIYSFSQLTQNLTQKIIQHKFANTLKYKEKSPKVELLLNFYDNLIACMKQISNVNKSRDKDWCQALNVMYESTVFKNMANNFGFYIPNQQAISL